MLLVQQIQQPVAVTPCWQCQSTVDVCDFDQTAEQYVENFSCSMDSDNKKMRRESLPMLDDSSLVAFSATHIRDTVDRNLPRIDWNWSWTSQVFALYADSVVIDLLSVVVPNKLCALDATDVDSIVDDSAL